MKYCLQWIWTSEKHFYKKFMPTAYIMVWMDISLEWLLNCGVSDTQYIHKTKKSQWSSSRPNIRLKLLKALFEIALVAQVRLSISESTEEPDAFSRKRVGVCVSRAPHASWRWASSVAVAYKSPRSSSITEIDARSCHPSTWQTADLERWGPFQHHVLHLIIRSRRVSRPRRSVLMFVSLCDLTCSSIVSNPGVIVWPQNKFRGFETSKYLMIRCLIGYWNYPVQNTEQSS